MRVIASKAGYFDVLRQPGEAFEVPDDTKPASWFAPETPPEAKQKSKGKPDAKSDEPLA